MDDAVATYRAQAEDASRPPADRARACEEAAAACRRSGSPELGVGWLYRASALQPDTAALRVRLATELASLWRWKEARAEGRRAEALLAADEEAAALRIDCRLALLQADCGELRSRRDYDAAIRSCEEFLATPGPGSRHRAVTCAIVSRLCRWKQSLEEAIVWIDRALEHDPNDERALEDRARLMVDAKRWREGEEAFRRLLKVGGPRAWVVKSLEACRINAAFDDVHEHVRRGEWDAALEACRRLADDATIAADLRAAACINAGHVALAAGRPEGEGPWLKRALALVPDHAEAQARLARAGARSPPAAPAAGNSVDVDMEDLLAEAIRVARSGPGFEDALRRTCLARGGPLGFMLHEQLCRALDGFVPRHGATREAVARFAVASPALELGRLKIRSSETDVSMDRIVRRLTRAVDAPPPARSCPNCAAPLRGAECGNCGRRVVRRRRGNRGV